MIKKNKAIQELLDFNSAFSAILENQMLYDKDILNHINFCVANQHNPVRVARSYACGKSNLKGTSAGWRDWDTKAALCYAAFNSHGLLVVGIGASPSDNPSPGRVWKTLQPFGKNLKDETILKKSREWADGNYREIKKTKVKVVGYCEPVTVRKMFNFKVLKGD